MAKKKNAVESVTLQCEGCKSRNYSKIKNKKKNTEKIELKKYCRKERKHTIHKEIK
ncbi:Ribosomal protein L33 [Candidatus Omnitrophus magneticus]|uniref:Large ribosomal subunit protein bL33 n=1 Tax=Candidatus Omnitrophus magneticus TaxID=1609969 RepID=A0A0F0CN79_9BACT|nr:Ribosomal protein L33 [Candidatus Omnitrophus magneticus]